MADGASREDSAGWTRAVCIDCGKPFPRRSDYEQRCMICYKESKDYKLLVGDLCFEWAQRTLSGAEAQLVDVKRQLDVSNRKLSATKKKLSAKQGQTGLSPVFLKKLIMLSHPDHHDGSRVATEVTQQLLSLRSKTK